MPFCMSFSGEAILWYRETSTYRYIKFSRFVEGTDGGTVNVSVTIFLPDEGQGFSKAWIEYTYY